MPHTPFRLVPQVGLLPIRLGMHLKDVNEGLATAPTSIVSLGASIKWVEYGDLAAVDVDEHDLVFGITCTLLGAKTVHLGGVPIIADGSWLPAAAPLIRSLGPYQLYDGLMLFGELGLVFPDRMDNADTSGQFISVTSPFCD
ncbi:hypothetical protein [Deinococcus radiotolerans]|uniref:Uncharacterized protein n=1 Tax=Deinococcus radiotolerans TaxID=1309407 RepID=A0ABQ2FQP3_9DEIO|nr:hypothetical protein [Deinococcus radiotolerans]GGL17545.1 hypothetical protein GCM10010844_40480 [Deinococcus radiotolerans]